MISKILLTVIICFYFLACNTTRPDFCTRNKIPVEKRAETIKTVEKASLEFSYERYGEVLKTLAPIDSKYKILSIQFMIAECHYHLSDHVKADSYYKNLYYLKPDEVKDKKTRKIAHHACMRKGDIQFAKKEPTAFYYYGQAIEFLEDKNFKETLRKELALKKVEFNTKK